MKKILLIVGLLIGSSSLFAQGGLRIDNSAGRCGVWVKMLAWDPSVPGDLVCQLNSFTFLVPAGVVWTWCTVYDFQGPFTCGTAPGAIGWAFGVPIPIGSPTFQWTDVTFQWDRCGDCNAGGNMSNAGPCGPSCWGAPQVFTSPACPANTAQWIPPCLAPLGVLTLVFTS